MASQQEHKLLFYKDFFTQLALLTSLAELAASWFVEQTTQLTNLAWLT